MRYHPYVIEVKWQKRWLQKKTYEPDLARAKRPAGGEARPGRPFYNLMMFPYPSAEGLHVGNMYAFVGADIYGRAKRMQGYDVFEPIGLDGFGIHSENYALSIGRHPAKQAKISEKNFYRQLGMIGNGFAWRERLETYDPDYYRWTQWIFVQLFKRGLAYRKKAAVNWCHSCKTVLADEQVVAGECERCGTKVVKKELEQWFFRITNYAERLLKNLEGIDWSEKIKVAQRNWIGKSEGADVRFPLAVKYNYVLLHGFKGNSKRNFFPWVKRELEKRGVRVFVPDLPNAANPREGEQVSYVLEHVKFDANTILLGHSLGSVVALKVLERLKAKIVGLVLVGGFLRPDFVDHPRPFAETFKWTFDFEKIKRNAGFVKILSDRNDYAVPLAEGRFLQEHLGGELIETTGRTPHFTAEVEPEVLENLFPSIIVFTTRPDTLFGATYMVLAPEHPLVKNLESRILNLEEVSAYIGRAKSKSEAERIAEGRGKTGVELKGVRATNPANGEKIPIWVADYVLGHVGTGAIMAVPAHDERDFEFAQKYNLPIRIVVCPHYPETACPVLDRAYEGKGHLVASGKFDGMPSEQAKWEITTFVGGIRKVQYRLRDWLISRQRYWGPPIPMIYCEKCARLPGGQGWSPVPEKDLPVKLPYINNFRPTGTEKSPLATIEKFYKVHCPKCRMWARRETDVSDTFLDSAWYHLRYPSVQEKHKPWNSAVIKKWLPVDMYIGGAEHAVLHLLYVRFLAMVFHDWGLTHFEEPFEKFRAHGLLIKDGAKMSKSRGNVVNPDEYIKAYGADALRMYLMFLGPFEQGGDFRDTGIRGITRFLERVWRFSNRPGAWAKQQDEPMIRNVHRTVKKVTDDIEGLQYNTAISSLMVLLNEFEANAERVTENDMGVFLKLLAPFAPFITEELWQSLQKRKGRWQSIHCAQWPRYDPKHLREDTFELVIQVNGKVRGRVALPVGASEEEARRAALGIERVRHYVTGEPKKVIFIPNTLINFVVE